MVMPVILALERQKQERSEVSLVYIRTCLNSLPASPCAEITDMHQVWFYVVLGSNLGHHACWASILATKLQSQHC